MLASNYYYDYRQSGYIALFSTIILSAVFLLFWGFLVPSFVFGGGVIMEQDGNDWKVSTPSHHSVFVNHKNGVQKMLVFLEKENMENDLLWVFPVPSSLENTETEIALKDASFFGKNLFIEAGGKIERAEKILFHSQVWPYFYDKLFEKELEKVFLEPLPIGDIKDHVKTYRYLEGEGVEIYLISAKEDAFLEFLEDKKLEINKDILSSFENYYDDDFSFIFSFIKSTEEKNTNVKQGFAIEFPTEDIHYPLSSMWIYGEKVVPITLNIADFVSLEIPLETKEDVKIDYYLTKKIISEEMGGFFENIDNTDKFTKIKISTLSKNLTEDLVIKEKIPFFVSLFLNIYKYPFVFSFFLFLILSFVSGMIAGPVVSGKDKNISGILRWGKIGLFNVFSIIGFVVRIGFEEMEKGKIQKPLIVFVYTMIFVLLSNTVIGWFFIF